MDEKLFLQSRENRYKERVQRKNNANNAEDDTIEYKRQQFWSYIKRNLNDWNNKLDVIYTNRLLVKKDDITRTSSSSTTKSVSSFLSKSNHVVQPYNDENEKRAVQLQLLQLSKELKSLQKECFGLSSQTTTTTTTTNKVILIQPDDMSLTDIRLLHKEFTTCQTKLDTIWDTILPKGKFVFRTISGFYEQRKLTTNHQIQSNQDEISKTTESLFNDNTTTRNTPTLNHNDTQDNATIDTYYNKQKSHDDGIIHGYRNVHIIIIQQPDDSRTDTTSETRASNDTKKEIVRIYLPLSASSLILQDIHDCTVEFSQQDSTSNSYKSLHIQTIYHSTIYIGKPIDGAIHITDCQYISIGITEAHQLRIHKTFDTNFIIIQEIISGIILEECKRITFLPVPTNTTSTNNNNNIIIMKTAATKINNTIDVKDFEWLRNGIPSPNYTILDPIIDQGRIEKEIQNLYEDLLRSDDRQLNGTSIESVPPQSSILNKTLVPTQPVVSNPPMISSHTINRTTIQNESTVVPPPNPVTISVNDSTPNVQPNDSTLNVQPNCDNHDNEEVDDNDDEL